MSNNGNLRVVPDVFTAIIEQNKILMLKRINTGWLDDYWDLPAGHLEDQEQLKAGAARELKEEAGLDAAVSDLKLIHVYQNHNTPDTPHYGFIFLTKKWRGKPKIMEPDKAADMKFFPLNSLPAKTTPYVKEALKKIGADEITFSYHEPHSITKD